MTTSFQLFSYGLIALGGISLFCSYWIFQTGRGNISSREHAARNETAGAILVFADLLWCIPNTKPLLPDSTHILLIPAAVLLTLAAWKLLDYLFSRALGGFLILLAHYLLHESFTYHTPAAPVFAVFCFIFGIAGLFFAGKPHLLRDLFRKCASSNIFRFSVSAFILAFACLSTILGIMQVFSRGSA